MITTFHRKMWQAKEEGYITQDEWKKLCNQPLKAFIDFDNHNLLLENYSHDNYSRTVLHGIVWGETNEDIYYWGELYEALHAQGV